MTEQAKFSNCKSPNQKFFVPRFTPTKSQLQRMSSEVLMNLNLTSMKHSKENVYFGHGAVQGDTLSKLTFCFNNGEQSPPKGSYISDPES